MMLPNDTRIAGEKTVANWTVAKGELQNGGDADVWNTAFSEFFKERINTRYFEPIQAIETIGQNKGEGFSIVALHCSLIEFLSSTIEGKTYKYQRNGQPAQNSLLEYSNSNDMFIKFLRTYEPFKGMFPSHKAAKDFYISVRCGLLHEASTKNGWMIKVDQSAQQAIDTSKKIVYRNKMQGSFDQFVAWYGEQLPKDSKLQQAFIRKFDSLCQG